MLSKKIRLTKKKDLERILRRGKHFAEKFFVLKTIENGLDHSRFGFMVSIKVSKKATVRNKIRRQLQEIVRINFARIKTGLDMIVIARPEIKEKDYQEIKGALLGTLKEKGLLI